MVKKKNKKKMLVENNWNSKKGWGIPCNSKIICFGVIVCYRVNFYWKKLSVLLLQRIMWVITKKNRLRKIQSIWRNMKGIMEQLIAGVIDCMLLFSSRRSIFFSPLKRHNIIHRLCLVMIDKHHTSWKSVYTGCWWRLLTFFQKKKEFYRFRTNTSETNEFYVLFSKLVMDNKNILIYFRLSFCKIIWHLLHNIIKHAFI